MSLRRLSGAAFAAALLAVAVLSLLPSSRLPTVSVSDKIEHLAAYAVLALIGSLRWNTARGLLGLGLALVALGGLLELAQGLVPGRFTDAADFAANCTGVLLGLLPALLWRWTFRLRRPA